MKTLKDLPGNWKEIILENMEIGKFPATVRKMLGIGHTAHKRLMEKCAEYHETFEYGMTLFESYWNEYLREHSDGKNNSTVFFILKAVCSYRDYEVQVKKMPGKGESIRDNEEEVSRKYETKDEKKEATIQ